MSGKEKILINIEDGNFENLFAKQMIRDSLLHEQARLLVQKFSHTQKRDTDIGTGEKCAQSAQVSIEGKSRGFLPDMEDLSKSPKSDMHDSSNIVVPTDKDRLKAGLELRTTLMIKKVPRKYAWY